MVDVFVRVAALLKNNAADANVGNVIEGMTHQDIAAVDGASREMLSTILADL